MYFDFDYYRRVLYHVWQLKQWPGRRRMLVRLLLVVPATTVLHAVCFLLDYLLFPRLWWQKVVKPVFIVGHARSGTTLIHRLMAADGDRFSYFLYWETFFPSLLQKKVIRGLGRLDAALLRGAIHRRLVAWDDKTFGRFRHIHDISLWNSEEDQFVMKAAFVTQQWSLDIPMTDNLDIFHLDQMPHKKRRWLHHYRECVKRQLLLNGGDRIHLSKNPVMSGWVEAIIETFPDARIVVMMRDPRQCIPSVLKLVEITWKSGGWQRADYARSLEVLTDISFDSFRDPRRALQEHPEVANCVVDYRDLTRAPRDTMRQVYDALGIELTDEYDTWLAAQSEREKKHASTFEYSIDEYDLSTERIERELAAFYEIYDWPRGNRDVERTTTE